MSELVALLTDFGLSDIYVGVMKGVMHRIHSPLDFIDVTHAIPPQSVRGGALALKNCYRYFKPGTVFLVVIDPGVGSRRRAIAVKAGDYYFVAPDNGVLSYVLQDFDTYEAVTLENPAYRLNDESKTFHGRDVFAPAAAHLARGVPLSEFGESLDELAVLSDPQLVIQEDSIYGEIVHIDHFGNIITSIGPFKWVADDRLVIEPAVDPSQPLRVSAQSMVRVLTTEISGISHAYHEAMPGTLLTQIDSNGQLEIAINQGNAAKRLGVTIGDEVKLYFK